MSTIDPNAMAAEANEFAASIDAPLDRWRYCHSRMSFRERRAGEIKTFVRSTGVPAVKRVLGLPNMTPWSVLYRLRLINRHGIEGANAKLSGSIVGGLDVGELHRWNIGHVYFLHVAALPHVVKIGFSRRVPERIDDIRKQVGERLVLSTLKVGTHIDEAKWHHNWRKFNIDGEWFFDPFKSERELPDFLAKTEAA